MDGVIVQKDSIFALPVKTEALIKLAMSLRIFNTKQAHKFPLLLVFLSGCFPVRVLSASCGLIPSTYPLYTDDEIKLEKDISINGTEVSEDDLADNDNQILPDLDPSSFPSKSFNDELEIDSTNILNSTVKDTYKKIEITQSYIDVTFSGGNPFYIEELKVDKKNVVLNFAPGTYYIDKFEINAEEVTINTSPSVIFHIGDSFKIAGASTKLNDNGNVDDLLVYLHSGAKFESVKKELDFTGLIYGPDVGEVIIKGQDSTIHGAIIVSEGEIKIEGKDTSFIYTPADQTAISTISTCKNNSGGGGSGGGGDDTTASDFNCVEPSTTDVTKKQVYTKLAGTSFVLDIVALKNGAIDTNYNKTVSIKVIDQISSNTIDSQTHTFNKTQDSGRKQLTFTINQAYRNLTCRVSYTAGNSSNSVVKDSDNFSVRPTGFTLSSTDLINTSIPSHSLAAKIKAGNNFKLTATAITGYDGTPITTNTNIEAHSGGIPGILLGTFNPANSTGEATGTSFNYSEVGFFRFLTNFVYDDTFTAVDQGDDCTDNFNTPVSGKIGCKFGNTATGDYFGRFTPNHFSLDTSSHTPSCSTYSYMGQAFNFDYTISARSASGAITQNYHGDYVKMSALDFVAAQLGTLNNETTKTYNLNKNSTGSFNRLKSPYKNESLLYDKTDWFKGQYVTTNSTTSFLRDTNIAVIDGAFNSLDIGIKVTDDDGINFDTLDMQALVNNDTCSTNTPNDCTEKKLISTKVRYGRIELQNAHGSELIDLPSSLTAQYWDGVSWALNSSDQCSTLNLLLTDPDATDGLTSAEVCVWDSGSTGSSGIGCSTAGTSTKKFNEPLTENLPFTKHGDFNLNFKAPGTGNTGSLDVTATVDSHLKFNWKGTGNIDPSSRITFGVYKGSDKQIYFREVY